MNAHITGQELKQESEGESIILGGKKYKVVLDFNAICDIEEKYGDFEKGMRKIEDGKMKDIRFLLAAMLRHSNDEMTENEVGKLITTSNIQEVMNALGKAMWGSAPQDGKKKEVSPQEI